MQNSQGDRRHGNPDRVGKGMARIGTVHLLGWSVLLLIGLVGGACTGMQKPIETPSHYFDKTEVDLEYGQPEAASRYRRPHGVQVYRYDETAVDLVGPPLSPPSPSPPPLPGGDR